MKAYIVEKMGTKTSYLNFIRIMLKHSNAFSVVYFKYRETEIPRRRTKKIRKMLEPFLIYSHRGNEWPAMATANQFNHIYDISLYKADEKTESALAMANDIFDWDYPKYPMDLCFYINGYAWFVCCSHEQFAYLYTDNDFIVNELKRNGVNLSFDEEVHPNILFYDNKAK